MRSYIRIGFWFLLALVNVVAVAQTADPAKLGGIKGKVIDQETKEPLIGATVLIVGTYKGASADVEGNFVIDGVHPGDYTIKITYIGYVERQYTGIHITKGEVHTLNASLKEAGKTLETVEIVGERAVVDLESGKSEVRVGAADIKEMTAKSVQDVVALQAGVSVSPDGLQIRGGRVYETQYIVDGISAQDPLAGTGFGVQVSSNSIQDVTLVTGGSSAEYNSNSGVVLTRIKEGGEKPSLFARWQRDNFATGTDARAKANQGAAWNTDIIDLNFGTPIPGTNKKLRLFTSLFANFNDTYYHYRANQLNSSLISNTKLLAPREDNTISNTVKLSYYLSPSTKISVTNQHSLVVNQNTRSLQIIGFNQIMVPGLQYEFAQQMDNATTYTHQTNLTAANMQHKFSEKWRLNVDVGRLFVNLRADANGRPFRSTTIDQILDPRSIITNPVQAYNPQDSNLVFVNPATGFYNNGGISTTWHDHYFEEYTLKYKFNYFSPNRLHNVQLGHEHKQQYMQWVDVTQPWIGQPIQLADGSFTPSRSIGSSSDVWKTTTQQGDFFVQDDIRYHGIIATLGARLEYWTPGTLADKAAADTNAQLVPEVRRQYNKQTFAFAGNRYKARLLPRLNVSFPVTENNVMYFNYSHTLKQPHPRFLNAGLDPVYQNNSFLANLGNPNLNPETAVTYEIGVKSQINRDFGVTLTAYYKDYFDYIVTNQTVVVRDQAIGRFVEKTLSINQDYARIRGAELMLNYRFSRRVRAMFNAAVQVATGKSNTALESRLQIVRTGQVNTTKELYLAFDRPYDLKATVMLNPDSADRFFGISLKGFRFFATSTLKSGLRYTSAQPAGVDEQGRVKYEQITTSSYNKIGTPWFYTDLRITRDLMVGRKFAVSASVDITNLFNNKNAQIVNPVTGTAYRQGDAVLYSQRDPNYTGPRSSGITPDNPARYLQSRQILYGISVSF